MKPAQPNASQMLSEGFLAVNFPWAAPTPFLFLLLDHPLLNSLVPPPSSAGQPRAHLEIISRKQDVRKGGASPTTVTQPDLDGGKRHWGCSVGKLSQGY